MIVAGKLHAYQSRRTPGCGEHVVAHLMFEVGHEKYVQYACLRGEVAGLGGSY